MLASTVQFSSYGRSHAPHHNLAVVHRDPQPPPTHPNTSRRLSRPRIRPVANTRPWWPESNKLAPVPSGPNNVPSQPTPPRHVPPHTSAGVLAATAGRGQP
jgi:hypothetical protein